MTKLIQPTRRDVLHLAGAAALAGVVLPHVHASSEDTVNVALIGCGGRGGGAAENAMQAQYGPTKLVAMADVFPGKLDACYDGLKKFEKTVDVPPERKFIGFDGYRKAMDCLKPGDIAILATPPAFRWVQFKYAIEKGLNVFMEKPVAVDGPTSKRMMELAEEAQKKNLKVGVGLMCRHCRSRGELFQRIKDGQLGAITLLRCYRRKGPEATCFSPPRPADIPELHYQIQRFHSFLWASGGSYSDFLIHNIDECCWMKDAWPIEAKGSGGRHYRGNNIDQNFDSYSVEYSFADGAKMYLEGRSMPGCAQEFASYCHGTNGSAVISHSGHAPSKSRIYPAQDMKATPTWKCPDHEPDPYQLEWDDLLEAIKKDKPYNEVKRGAQASLVTAMGRMAAHTGHVITYDQMLNGEHEFAPDVDKLTLDGDAPVKADADGKYPVPEPGKKKTREY
jgi:predicted dehydrogenase